MSEGKLLGGQCYFISKVLEYFDFSNQQMPIFYKALQDKRYDSIVLMFHEFLEIEKDIREGTSDKTKLKHSMNSSLKSILFHCKQNPWVLKGQLSRDVNFLIKRIDQYLKDEEKEKDCTSIRLSISSLAKRYESESLISEYIDFILNEPLSFKEIDLLVQYFISEIILLGYSFKYLSEWKQKYKQLNKYTKDLNKVELEEKLLLFKDLIKEPIRYLIIINSWLPDELKNDLDQNGFINIEFKYEKLNGEEENVVIEKAEKLNYPKSEQYKNLLVEVVAYDKYKAIEKVVKNLEGYLEMYKHHLNFDKKAVNVSCLLKVGEEYWKQMRTDNVDNQIFNKKISKRENEDIKDFISVRDKVRKQEGTITSSIKQLNNSLEILKKSNENSPENRLLNNWSGLEYILNTYEGKSIIGKVIDVIPKVICLYLIKDRMNILWDNLVKIKSSKDYEKIDVIEEIFSNFSEREEKYDKNKLVEYLSTEQNLKKLYTALEQNVIMQREIAYLREMFISIGTFIVNIKALHESIEHDLTRIYRLRNKLVHSENNVSFNIDIFTIRLNKYINSLIGTLIHYLKRQPNLLISEILNSIHETYEWYISMLENAEIKEKQIGKEKAEGKNDKKEQEKEGEKGIKAFVDINTVAFPPYLFM